jgi:uncharacterized protein DUF4430
MTSSLTNWYGQSRRLWLATLALCIVGTQSRLMADEPSKTVQLTIDYGDGVQKVFRNLEWKERMTVLDALQLAAKHPRGIKFSHRGSGATAFVTSIDEQTNEGAGRNWLYEVNGKPANKSCGVWELKAGDSVLWQFKGSD